MLNYPLPPHPCSCSHSLTLRSTNSWAHLVSTSTHWPFHSLRSQPVSVTWRRPSSCHEAAVLSPFQARLVEVKGFSWITLKTVTQLLRFSYIKQTQIFKWNYTQKQTCNHCQLNVLETRFLLTFHFYKQALNENYVYCVISNQSLLMLMILNAGPFIKILKIY